MHKSKIFLIIGILMLIIMILFIIYALQHPEGSFGFNLRTTYILYFIYLVIMIGMFVIFLINRNK